MATERFAANPDGTQRWPEEVRLKRAEKILEITFDDGIRYCLPAELLRVESPSAEVQGHGPSQKQTIAGKRQVGITALEAVGHYAIRLSFDDGHDSGIYSWQYLYDLGHRQDELWSNYLAALADRGLSRDR